MIKGSTKAKITKLLNDNLVGNRSMKLPTSEITSQIIEIVEAGTEPVTGYEPASVEVICHAFLDSLLDKRKALNFQGHSIPHSVIERLQQAMNDGKIHQEVGF